MSGQKTCLVIIDGFGISENNNLKDSTKYAKNIEHLIKNNIFYKASASGEAVGLPKDFMGNSEVGHLTIGSGRIVNQSLMRIEQAYKNGEFKNKILELTKYFSKRIHLVGLVSDGGVHSHVNHLRYLIEILKPRSNIFIHAIADGRDTAPKEYKKWHNEFENIVSVAGRFYTMDRDNNYERIDKSFKMMTEGIVNEFCIENLYQKGITDEFIEPILIKPEKIHKEDTIIFFNFREDRMKQIVKKFSQYCAVYTLMDLGVEDVKVIFKKTEIKNTLPEILSINNKKQTHIAETEKYAHVTYFFNGGREIKYSLETWVLINSPKVISFEDKPETSSQDITEACIDAVKALEDFIVINFASTDLVGHTGNYEKACEAVKAVDGMINKIYLECLARNYCLIITADHGNCETMEVDGEICKKHTNNKVPLIIINSYKKLENRDEVNLADIAPTICDLMEIKIPVEMNGKSLIKKV